MSQSDSSTDTSSDFTAEHLHTPAAARKEAPPYREGLPPSYRMRADAHYVDALMSRTAAGREEQIPVTAIEPPGDVDEQSIAPLVESVRRHGLLQPLIVQKRKGRHRLIAGRRRLAAAIEAGLREVPCLVHEVGHEEAKALAEAANIRALTAPATASAAAMPAGGPAGALLEQSLATLMACSTALSSVNSALSRNGVTELIRAEAWRASCLALAARLVRGELTAIRTSLSVARVVDSVTESFGPELRIRRVEIDADVTPKGLHATVDAQAFSAALANGLLLTLAILDTAAGARVRIAASLNDADELTVSIGQNSVGVPDAWAARAFDESWHQRPGGDAALVAGLAVRSAAELLEGRCQLSGGVRSTRLVLAIPHAMS